MLGKDDIAMGLRFDIVIDSHDLGIKICASRL